ncbi:hypothetical protein CMI38_00515 [Candidatus Pacearchaeota archaeon]|jgi:kynurenine formamidase|nr:hypothetical protein [Candidatus Pacearchaeota archaeon]|tara:strand:- start:264 stop:797 length:534 start_codon:yes stop_codon:yes gene_type:complete
MRKVIDLTREIYTGMMVYPGDPEVKIIQSHNIAEHGYKVSRLVFGSHNSTHVDAQSHMVEDGKTLSDYGVDRFIGDALYVRRPDDIAQSEVLVVDGPKFNDSLIERIIAISPKMVGFVLDNDLDEEGVGKFLKEDILPVGPLNIREALPDKFLFVATPLNIRYGDGSPVRAIAITYE